MDDKESKMRGQFRNGWRLFATCYPLMLIAALGVKWLPLTIIFMLGTAAGIYLFGFASIWAASQRIKDLKDQYKNLTEKGNDE